MKGHIRIGGSLLLGLALVAGAYFLRSEETVSVAGTVQVVEAPPRTYIETEDANADGIRDWEEELKKNLVRTIELPPAPEGEYALDNTYTGKFARSFFEDFVKNKTGKPTAIDAESFVATAVESIEQNTNQTFFLRRDIVIIEDSEYAIREYGNRIGEIIIGNSVPNENEASILNKALAASDPSILERIAPIRSAYEKIVTETKTTPVPKSFVEEHLALLNTYQAVLTDVIAMEGAFIDPLYTLARMKRYEDDATGMFFALENIRKKLEAQDIVYSKEEAGSALAFFETL